MTDRASADLLIDAHRLSDLLGRPVRATRLRFKPALSTTALLLDARGDRPPQWVQVGHPEHADKLRKAVELAHERGQVLHLREVDGLSILHGTIDTDPRLQKGLDAVRETHGPVTAGVEAGRLGVLRYNPQRRLVLRQEVPHQDPVVLRVTHGRQPGAHTALAALAVLGVPVVEPLRDGSGPRSKRVSVWPWFGRGDLSSLVSDSADAAAAAAAAAAAGAALARLHTAATPAAPGEGSAGSAFPPVPDPVRALSAQVQDLAALEEDAAERLSTLVARVSRQIGTREWVTGLTHGDFSADQVLVGRPGEDLVRLTDFDRAGHGPLAADLGSFAAAELLDLPHRGPGAGSVRAPDLGTLPLTRAMLEGYAAAGGPAVHHADDEAVRVWTARALLGRVLEPFRAADPDWVAGIHRRMDQVGEVLP